MTEHLIDDERDEAAELLASVYLAQVSARERLAVVTWLPYVMYGVLSMASAVVAWHFGAESLAFFWLAATPLALGLTRWLVRRGEHRLGAVVSAAPAMAATAVIVAGAALTGAIGGATGRDLVAAAGPPFAVAVGLIVLGRTQHARSVLAAGVTLAVATTGVIAAGAGADATTVTLAVVAGVLMVAAGVERLVASRRWR